MSTTSDSRGDSSPKILGHVPIFQVSPWAPRETLLLAISLQGTQIVRLAVTGDDPAVGSRYSQMTEYWRTNNLSLLGGLTAGAQLDLVVASSSCTDADIDNFFGSFQAVGSWSETPPTWNSGSYTASTGSTVHYFAMPDLDSSAQGRRVGLSFVIANGALVGVGWHKSFNPGTNGFAWTPPALGVIKRYLTYVGSSASSLNVGTSSNWWYVLQP